MLRERRSVFDPDDIAKLDIAFHAVLHQLGLADREDGAWWPSALSTSPSWANAIPSA
jgi:hypothetical protein